MSNVKAELLYTKEHDWIKVEGNIATIGITDFAQNALGDIVFCEVPEVGTTLSKGDTFGVVESIKSVTDLHAPVSGEVIESNSALADSPEAVNQNPYGSWFMKVKLSDAGELDDLMNATDYQAECGSH